MQKKFFNRSLKRTAGRMFQLLLLLLLAVFLFFLRKVFPLINGYAAKTMCSGFFVSQRTQEDIRRHELGSFPFNLASVAVNLQDSSATAVIAGLFERTALYRNGLGATLISANTAAELRKQHFYLSVPPAINQDSIDWPQGNRTHNPLLPALDTLQTGNATRALLVLYKGKIVAEKYAAGFTLRTRQPGWSMAKGIENALLGILVNAHRLNIDAPAPVAAWKNDPRNSITTSDLMHMSSGLHYASSPNSPSDLTEMLFMQNNMAAFAQQALPEHPPGRVFHYADASANILSAMERSILGDSAYYRLPYEKLFYKTGMYSALLEVDGSGNFVGSSYCYATARDWARFGLLYLNDGVWNGERILPPGWVQFTRKPSGAINNEKKGEYGALWWLNAVGKNGLRKFPHVPADAFACQGYEGQFVWVVPSRQLVVVRLALERGKKLDVDALLSGIISALPQ